MYIEQSHLRVENSVLHFIRNSACLEAYGGAIFQTQQSSIYIVISGHSRINFVGNKARYQGGAACHFIYSTIAVDGHSSLVFQNISAVQGGVLSLRIVIVGGASYVEFSYDTASKYGGTIYAGEQRCVFNFKSNCSKKKRVCLLPNGGTGMHNYLWIKC